MLNVLLQSQIAEEDRKFTIADVLARINKKVVDRHPHVFGGGPMPKDADAAVEQWNHLKSKERKTTDI
jgi:tetrapyrrole methylase family protein/MazG family protein